MDMRQVGAGPTPGVLVLADGSVFEGDLIGADTPSSGEVVFNTAMSGYQEILTDPSYAGQIITFTNPHVGNYGVNLADFESRRLFCRGVVVRELARRPSNRNAQAGLGAMLERYGIPGIAGVDTRRLTRVIRETGAIPGAIGAADDFDAVRAAAANEPGTDGIDLVAQVSTPAPYSVGADGPLTIVAYDFGIKRTILRHLARFGRVDVVPASTSAGDVLAKRPDGVFLSNGPGDPAEVPYAVETIRGLLGDVPIFGICLGHQLLGRAIGAETVKLPFGHHGANHPVKDLTTGHIEITSQNHNFAVHVDSLGGRATMTHVNLNDGVCEGLQVADAQAFSVQHHPEAGPGPHESAYLFERFLTVMSANTGRETALPPLLLDQPGLPAADLGVA